MEHTLYRLDNTKVAFENHCPINAKLFRPTFNYPKFHALTHLVKYIQHYDTVYNKTAYKYLLKAFYRRINKKAYKLQILKYNIHHTNIIAIQNAIVIAKVQDGNAKKTACCWHAQYRGHVGM